MKRTKKNDILLAIFIFIIVFSVIIKKPLGDLDELWNYNTARAISVGLIPYKDISMITTPLLPMATAIFLKIFADELIVSRILAAVLWTGILYTIYKIFRNLIKDENASLILTTLIGLLCRDAYCIDYNGLALFITLIIVYLELKNIDKLNSQNEKTENLKNNNIQINNILICNKKYEFLIGVLVGLVVCTKQSIGAVLAIMAVVYKLLFVKNKEDFKQYLKIAFTRILGILFPFLILVIYLLATGALQDFINYAVLGIKTFSNKIEYRNLLGNDKLEIKLLAILMPILIILTSIIIIVEVINDKKNKIKLKIEFLNLIVLFIYGISMIIIMYPITDEIHFIIGMMISIITIIYLVFAVGKNDNWIFKEKKLTQSTKKKIYKCYIIITDIICIVLFIFILEKAVTNLYNYSKVNKNKEINHYKNIEVSVGLSKRIKEVDNYILENEKDGKKVYIVNADAAIYMIPIDKYNKNFDMLLKGNIGKDGEDGIINNIKTSSNCLYLIMKPQYTQNWQTTTKIIDYIKNNFYFVDEISIFDVYEK